ncbi:MULTISPECIES: hypothetical protein [unclassified Nostoc]|uniref:hypothetical protein n=1 Tax=unclassified Nostoc TaxID=2593658 RepID=UPI001D76BE1C|nr:hypothetical protein [Nostoc sp. JL23]MBN3875334.1 hypothetical protein [Nostoc sp. JL23]
MEYRLRGWGALCFGLSLSITYLKEALRTRIGVKSPEAVFVAACKEGKKPEAAQVKSEITAWR